jgi:hypothetical protein
MPSRKAVAIIIGTIEEVMFNGHVSNLAQCCRASSSYERKPTMVIPGIEAIRKSVVVLE